MIFIFVSPWKGTLTDAVDGDGGITKNTKKMCFYITLSDAGDGDGGGQTITKNHKMKLTKYFVLYSILFQVHFSVHCPVFRMVKNYFFSTC